jgi:serine/threonine protein kinase
VTTPALLTGSGIILGTAAYMSPEQAKAQEADKRSDVWAFGCVLFELLTGTAAFQAGTVSETPFHRDGQSQTDLWLLQLPNDPSPKTGDPRPLLQSPADEGLGQFSPDGKWMMYVSRESGRSEIYLAPYSGGGAKRQVSSGGGINPRWRGDGREVYYLTLSGGLRAVEIGWQGDTPILGRGQDLFDGLSMGTGYVSDVSRGYSYDVSPDGQKFIVVQDRTAQAPPLTVVQNWNALLRK